MAHRRRPRTAASGALAAAACTVALVAAACSSGRTAVEAQRLARAPARGVTRSRLTYCASGGSPQTLDLYQPNPAPGSPVPTVVFFHSGAWVTGDSSFAPASLTGLAEQAIVGHGWIFASANYRLAPKDTWPAQIEDAKCAVRYLRANAATLHIDAAHIGAMGSSAGAQLASLLGLAGPAAGFDVGEHVDQSSAVQAVVDQCGPADLTTSDWAASGAALAFASTVFGENFGRNTALLAQASPVSFVAPGAPPFLIQQGAADTTVYPVQSQELASRLQAAGDSATLEMVQNAGHEFAPAGPTPISPSIAQLATDATSFFFRALGT